MVQSIATVGQRVPHHAAKPFEVPALRLVDVIADHLVTGGQKCLGQRRADQADAHKTDALFHGDLPEAAPAAGTIDSGPDNEGGVPVFI